MSYGQISIIKQTGEASRISCPINSKGITIGRDLNCDIRVQMPKVSRLHCKVSLECQKVILHNLSKNAIAITNHSLVTKIGRNKSKELTDGDIFRIVDRQFRFDTIEDKENMDSSDVISIKDVSTILTVENNSNNRRKISIEPNEQFSLGKRKRSSSIDTIHQSHTEKIPRIGQKEICVKKNSLIESGEGIATTDIEIFLDSLANDPESPVNDEPNPYEDMETMENSMFPNSDTEEDLFAKDPNIAICKGDKVFQCGQLLKKQVGSPLKFQVSTPKPSKACRPASILKTAQTERQKRAVRVSFATQDKVLLTPMNPKAKKPALLYNTPAKTRSPVFKTVELPVLPRVPDEFKDDEPADMMNDSSNSESDEGGSSDESEDFVIRSNGISPSMFQSILSETDLENPLDFHLQDEEGEAEAIAELTSNRQSFGEGRNSISKSTTRTKNQSLSFLPEIGSMNSPSKSIENLSIPTGVNTTPIESKSNKPLSNCKSTGNRGNRKMARSSDKKRQSEGGAIQFTPPSEPFMIAMNTSPESTPMKALNPPTEKPNSQSFVDMKLFSSGRSSAGPRKRKSRRSSTSFCSSQSNQEKQTHLSTNSPVSVPVALEEFSPSPVQSVNPIPPGDYSDRFQCFETEDETNFTEQFLLERTFVGESQSSLNTPPQIQEKQSASTPVRISRSVVNILATPVRVLTKLFSVEEEEENQKNILIPMWKTIRDHLREMSESAEYARFITLLYEGDDLLPSSFVTKKEMFNRIRDNTYHCMDDFSSALFVSLDQIRQAFPELTPFVKSLHQFACDTFHDDGDDDDGESESNEEMYQSFDDAPGPVLVDSSDMSEDDADFFSARSENEVQCETEGGLESPKLNGSTHKKTTPSTSCGRAKSLAVSEQMGECARPVRRYSAGTSASSRKSLIITSRRISAVHVGETANVEQSAANTMAENNESSEENSVSEISDEPCASPNSPMPVRKTSVPLKKKSRVSEASVESQSSDDELSESDSDEILIELSEDEISIAMSESSEAPVAAQKKSECSEESQSEESSKDDSEILVDVSSSEEELPQQAKEIAAVQLIPKIDYNSWTCVKLRKELKDRKLDTKGLKACLVQRLEEDDQASWNNSSSHVDISLEEDIQIEKKKETTAVDYNKMTCVVLRKELKSRGLETKGLKKHLVDRLTQNDSTL